MSRSLKIILFPLGCLLSHVGRLTEIGKELRKRGHEVVFGGEAPSHPRTKLYIPQQQGFRLVYAKEPDYRYAWDRFEKYGWLATAWDLFRHRHWAPLDEILEGHVQLIHREKPDLVVGDATISVSTAAHIAGIPAAGVMNLYAWQFISPASIFTPMIHTWDALELSRLRRRVYRKYGKKQVNALRLLKNILVIAPDLPGLYDPPTGWPKWQPVGPIYSEVDAPLPEWYDELDDSIPNVYVTMGSTGLLDAFLRRTYEDLAKAPYRFLVTTGGQVAEETVAMAPPNFRIATYAPGSKLLERCQAMIFHGGNGTMYQALAAGVPMIALPSHLEQKVCFRPAIKHGFGLEFSPRRVRANTLLKALDEIIHDEGYRQAAHQFSQPIHEANGVARAADVLEQTAREGRPVGI